MRKTIIGVFTLATLLFTACKSGENTTEENKEKGDKTEAKKEEKAKYTVVAEESLINWKGSWVGGKEDGKQHHGTVQITAGSITKDGDQMTGKMTVDLTTINNQDLEKGSKLRSKFQGHMASEEFFNTSEAAKVNVDVNGIKDDKAMISIHILGTVIEQTIPVSIQMEGENMMLSGDFTVDFNKLDMKGMQPDPENPEKGSVSSEIEFELDVKLVKQ